MGIGCGAVAVGVSEVELAPGVACAVPLPVLGEDVDRADDGDEAAVAPRSVDVLDAPPHPVSATVTTATAHRRIPSRLMSRIFAEAARA